jgi:Ulp1 family protease
MRERTQEEKDLVRIALDKKSGELPMEKLVTEGTDSVTRQSMHTLCGGVWLNDEVINFFVKTCLDKQDVTLCDRHGNRKRSHSFSSYFMRQLFDNKNINPNLWGV